MHLHVYYISVGTLCSLPLLRTVTAGSSSKAQNWQRRWQTVQLLC